MKRLKSHNSNSTLTVSTIYSLQRTLIMDIEKEYDLSLLHNDTLGFVLKEMGERLEHAQEEGFCLCQDCVLDAIALAMNMLKPYYHASLLGNMYANAALENTYAREVKIAVQEALQKIKNNPSHD